MQIISDVSLYYVYVNNIRPPHIVPVHIARAPTATQTARWVAGVLEIRLFTIPFIFSFTATQTARWVGGVLEIRLFTITFFFSFTATQTATWIGPLCRIGPTGARAAPARTHTRTHAHTRMSREAFDGEAGRVQRHGHNAFK